MRALPFVHQLPPGLFNSLDTSTFCLPVGESARLRAALEQELAAHVMTYRAASFASEAQRGLQLCRLLKPARLVRNSWSASRRPKQNAVMVESCWWPMRSLFKSNKQPLLLGYGREQQDIAERCVATDAGWPR